MHETYRIIDRVNMITNKPWPDGPWNDEPDQVQWRDERSGLRCVMRRNPPGHWCGYVGVPPQNIFHNKYYAPEKGNLIDGELVVTPVEYNELIEKVDVHGGITLCDADIAIENDVSAQPKGYYWWIGFDCAHGFDFSPGLPIMAVPGAAYRETIFVAHNWATSSLIC